MAFIEPMHRNKPNITYLLGQMHFMALQLDVYDTSSTWD